jgi:L-amino acid N-acyltransferase YncA
MVGDPISTYLLAAYPKAVNLRDGTPVVIRPLIPQDRAEIGEFFERVPEGDRAFLNEDLENREQVEIWLDQLVPERETVMVAVAGSRITGTAILDRPRHGWSRHVGEIRIVADPAFRQRGLGHVLAETIFDIANNVGLEKLTAQMFADNPGPIRVFKRLGFRTEATLNDQIKDHHGHHHDLIIMAHYSIDGR